MAVQIDHHKSQKTHSVGDQKSAKYFVKIKSKNTFMT